MQLIGSETYTHRRKNNLNVLYSKLGTIFEQIRKRYENRENETKSNQELLKRHFQSKTNVQKIIVTTLYVKYKYCKKKYLLKGC